MERRIKGGLGQEKTEDYQPWKQVLEVGFCLLLSGRGLALTSSFLSFLFSISSFSATNLTKWKIESEIRSEDQPRPATANIIFNRKKEEEYNIGLGLGRSVFIKVLIGYAILLARAYIKYAC